MRRTVKTAGEPASGPTSSPVERPLKPRCMVVVVVNEVIITAVNEFVTLPSESGIVMVNSTSLV